MIDPINTDSEEGGAFWAGSLWGFSWALLLGVVLLVFIGLLLLFRGPNTSTLDETNPTTDLAPLTEMTPNMEAVSDTSTDTTPDEGAVKVNP
jgi:hypothetical protein